MSDASSGRAPDVTYKLQKVLAQAGLGSRRKMEELVRAGLVTVNGVAATIGARVGPRDVIKVEGRALRRESRDGAARVLLYHKPEGEIVSRDDPGGRVSVFERLPAIKGAKWLAVGRLDYNTGGLLVLTSSGELANRMMHPRYGLEREYAVRLRGKLGEPQMKQLRAGVRLEDGVARLESLEDRGGEGANHWYHVTIREGRNRVLRRLFEALGLSVSRLMRVRFGSVRLPPQLKRGQFIELSQREVRQLLASLGLPVGEPKAPSSNRQGARNPGRAGPQTNRASSRKPGTRKPWR
jgi:23S rRNA pseudouridine2605 synthase